MLFLKALGRLSNIKTFNFNSSFSLIFKVNQPIKHSTNY